MSFLYTFYVDSTQTWFPNQSFEYMWVLEVASRDVIKVIKFQTAITPAEQKCIDYEDDAAMFYFMNAFLGTQARREVSKTNKLYRGTAVSWKKMPDVN